MTPRFYDPHHTRDHVWVTNLPASFFSSCYGFATVFYKLFRQYVFIILTLSHLLRSITGFVLVTQNAESTTDNGRGLVPSPDSFQEA
jgi:hypothetical protein